MGLKGSTSPCHVQQFWIPVSFSVFGYCGCMFQTVLWDKCRHKREQAKSEAGTFSICPLSVVPDLVAVFNLCQKTPPYYYYCSTRSASSVEVFQGVAALRCTILLYSPVWLFLQRHAWTQVTALLNTVPEQMEWILHGEVLLWHRLLAACFISCCERAAAEEQILSGVPVAANAARRTIFGLFVLQSQVDHIFY